MNPNRTIANKLVITYLVAFAGLAQAKSGEETFNICLGGEILSSIEIAPQQSITTVKSSGIAKAVPSGGIFDQLGVACHGTISTVGGPPVSIAHCVYVDKDGDKYVIRSMADKSESLGGTGKFTGMKGSGEFKVTRFPAIPGTRNVCVDGTFKYTLPD